MAVATDQLAPTVRHFTKGRSNAVRVEFRDGDGALVDDGAASYKLSARTGYGAASLAFSQTATQQSPGVAVIIVPPSSTASLDAPSVYVHEVEVTEGTGRRTTVELGRIILHPAVGA